MNLRFIAATTLAACATFFADARKIHTIGDSTMATYSESTTVTRGWGQMFQQFFKGDITVNNRAKSGASSKSFYEESAYWQSVKKQIEPGDYVIISFAHNDEKNNGCDGDSLKAYYTANGDATTAASLDYRGTTPSGTYKAYLRKYISETRALGATPILMGAICRKYFTGSTIRRNGRHDLGDSFDILVDGTYKKGQKVSEDNHSMDYPYQMKLVAEEQGVPYLDLTTATKELYESYGDAKANELLFDGNGSTHTSAMGATLIARLAAQLMQKAGILTEYINLTSELSVSPTAIDLGKAYKGQTTMRELQISGFDLTPSVGTVNISASNGLMVSVDGTAFGQQASLEYKEGNVIGTVQVRYEFQQTGAVDGSVTISCGDKTLSVPVTGECVKLADGATAIAYWRLEKDDQCTVTGPINPVGESYSEMVLQKYSNPNANTTWPDYTGFTADRKVQRNVIAGEKWPAGEIDEVSTRWIEFAVEPAKGTTLNVDSIGMFVCGCGGNGMRCKIYYSKEADFANAVNIADFSSSMVANNMMAVSAQPVLTVEEGETLRIRIYPWYNGAATGKTLCVSDVTVHGVATDNATGVKTITSSEACPTTYYNICGMRQTTLHDGLNIIVENGKAIKVMKR